MATASDEPVPIEVTGFRRVTEITPKLYAVMSDEVNRLSDEAAHAQRRAMMLRCALLDVKVLGHDNDE